MQGAYATYFSQLTGAPTPDGTTIGLTSVFSATLPAPSPPTFTGPVTGTMSAGSASMATAAVNLSGGGCLGDAAGRAGASTHGRRDEQRGIDRHGVRAAGGSVGLRRRRNFDRGPGADPSDRPAHRTDVQRRWRAQIDWEAIVPGTAPGLTASWPIANTRWYCVDGSVSSPGIGYSDTSEADCGTKAVQTLAQLAAILPIGGGANHKIKIAINQGTYTDPPTFLSMLTGYNSSERRFRDWHGRDLRRDQVRGRRWQTRPASARSSPPG